MLIQETLHVSHDKKLSKFDHEGGSAVVLSAVVLSAVVLSAVVLSQYVPGEGHVYV
jgi:hypothetical protein